MKNFFFIIITLFSSFKLLISNCIPNQNCLKERGECIDNICVCYHEFWTLKPNKENNLPNIFCNYEKRSRFLPLILEFFLPGIGHIVMKKYLLGIIKIILWATMTILFYTDFQQKKIRFLTQAKHFLTFLAFYSLILFLYSLLSIQLNQKHMVLSLYN